MLCCNVNTYVICACGERFCQQCWGPWANITEPQYFGNGHILRAEGTSWSGHGYCVTLHKKVTSKSRLDSKGPWILIEMIDV
jgi:hypothetical protein